MYKFKKKMLNGLYFKFDLARTQSFKNSLPHYEGFAKALIP